MSNKNEASGESENDEIHWNESSEKWTYDLRLSDIKIVPSSCNDTNYQERIFQFDLLFVSTAETLSVIPGDSFVRGRRSRDVRRRTGGTAKRKLLKINRTEVLSTRCVKVLEMGIMIYPRSCNFLLKLHSVRNKRTLGILSAADGSASCARTRVSLRLSSEQASSTRRAWNSRRSCPGGSVGYLERYDTPRDCQIPEKRPAI